MVSNLRACTLNFMILTSLMDLLNHIVNMIKKPISEQQLAPVKTSTKRKIPVFIATDGEGNLLDIATSQLDGTAIVRMFVTLSSKDYPTPADLSLSGDYAVATYAYL
jgi:hypothetical protein